MMFLGKFTQLFLAQIYVVKAWILWEIVNLSYGMTVGKVIGIWDCETPAAVESVLGEAGKIGWSLTEMSNGYKSTSID